MLRGFYHQQWWFDEEFHEGSMMVIPYVYSNHSNNNIYIYVCVCIGGERNPHEHNLFRCEKGTGVNWPMAILENSAGCLGYPYSLSALIFRVETSRLDIVYIYIYRDIDIDIVYIYI